MDVFTLGRLGHLDLLALLFELNPTVNELAVRGTGVGRQRGKPRCSKETLHLLVMEAMKGDTTRTP